MEHVIDAKVFLAEVTLFFGLTNDFLCVIVYYKKNIRKRLCQPLALSQFQVYFHFWEAKKEELINMLCN